jgi:hypothetical protein
MAMSISPVEIARQFGKPGVLAFGSGEFQCHIPSVLVTAFRESLAECSHLRDPLGGGACIEEPDHRNGRLLRARNERLSGRRAAERG